MDQDERARLFRLFTETIVRMSRIERLGEIDAYLAERRKRRQPLSQAEQHLIWQHARQLRARDRMRSEERA